MCLYCTRSVWYFNCFEGHTKMNPWDLYNSHYTDMTYNEKRQLKWPCYWTLLSCVFVCSKQHNIYHHIQYSVLSLIQYKIYWICDRPKIPFSTLINSTLSPTDTHTHTHTHTENERACKQENKKQQNIPAQKKIFIIHIIT